jgi:ATP-dependent Zn protease
VKNLLLGAVLGFGLAVVLAAVLLSGPAVLLSGPPIHLAQYETPYSRFIADLDDGKIEEVTFQGSKVFGRLKDHRVFETVAPPSHVPPALIDRLLFKSVTVTVRAANDASAVSIVNGLRICLALHSSSGASGSPWAARCWCLRGSLPLT